MKRYLLFILLFLLTFGGKGWASHGLDQWSIVFSKHNLAGGLSSNLPISKIEEESGLQAIIDRAKGRAIYLTDSRLVMQRVCIFCHTPHAANSSTIILTNTGSPGEAVDLSQDRPLWNRTLSTSNYTMYLSPTMDQTPPNAPIGVSRTCLSCHDGTIALDALQNWPGSGDKALSTSDPTSPSGQLGGTPFTYTRNGTNISTMPPDTIANLGTDLSDDHPVSIWYGAAGYDEDMWWDGDERPWYAQGQAVNAPTVETLPISVGVYGSSGGGATSLTGTQYNLVTLSKYEEIWFNENGDGVNGRPIPDDNEIILYRGRVECASCHNVHGTDDGTGHPYATFLRKSNRGSNVCLTCHIK